MIRLKEVLDGMPNAFHSISTNPNSGDNFVSAMEWVRWGKFSAPLSKRCPAASGLQFPPYLVMDAFLGRKKYDSFLGNEGLHLRAWLPSNLRAFIASIEYHYRIPEFVKESRDPRLMGVLDGIIESYTGERGFMGTHRYKVFGILEVAFKTGRTETNGNSGGADTSGRPWEEVHQQFSDAMKERLEPFRGDIAVEPHQMRGTFEECRYAARVLSRSSVDTDPERSISQVTLDIRDTGITFQPGDRLAIMPLNSWEECAKVAAALGLDEMLEASVSLDAEWTRFSEHLDSVSNPGIVGTKPQSVLTVQDVLRRGHLAPLTQDLALKIHALLRASSNTVLQVLATDEWPVRGTLGDLLQAAVLDTPSHIWDQAFGLSDGLSWLTKIVTVEIPRTYSISSCPDELLPSTVDLTISRAEYNLCATFAGSSNTRRCGVSSGFLNPPMNSAEYFSSLDDQILVGISRPIAFQLPVDGAAPCAFFAGGSGIAPFRSFWQSRAGQTVGRNILYLGVQNREKFCYEDELRQYVSAGLMEVHLAFSRDSRGLEYDSTLRDLVERRMEPRYIDSLISEQGATVCDLAMSKKQGGLGGYLYICGSVSVFDSVMKGLRKAIYNHRTATIESTDIIINTAFAERRIMLDVFMTPKPLPCNQPTISLAQVAMHTGHRPDSRIWITVHGSVYDVTDFCPMHPGGTMILKSNAGVDCTRSFDNLAHTNNPEVASLLTKYFIGHLTPKPDFQDSDELSNMYHLWADYLRTTVETLVAQQFEMEDILKSSKFWFQGSMINILGVRIFYQYQSRLLQSGFSALFGPKFQELVLKLSFTMASAASSHSGDAIQLPDILGTIARAKTSSDAVATSKELALIGQYVCNGESARFQERGIMDYASKSVNLDIELLEDIREEACKGMDAFDTIMSIDVSSNTQRVTAMCSFTMQILERMGKRLEVFYSKLAQHSIYQPEMELNPARTRWDLARRCIRDGSLFVLAQPVNLEAEPVRNTQETIEFENVLFQIQKTIKDAPSSQTTQLDKRQHIRAQGHANAPSAMESYENGGAVRRMSSFIDSNQRAIRRMSRVPLATPADLEQMIKLAGQQTTMSRGVPTPPSSRGSSRSPSDHDATHTRTQSGAEMLMKAMSLNRRGRSEDITSRPPEEGSLARRDNQKPPSPPPSMDSKAMMRSMMGKLNSSRSRHTAPNTSRSWSGESRGRTSRPISPDTVMSLSNRTSSTSTLRTFRLREPATGQLGNSIAPTF